MTDEINVLSRTQIINVEPSSGAVSVINAGPVGPPGEPGGGGGDSLWEYGLGSLNPDHAASPGLEDILIEPVPGNDTYIEVFDDDDTVHYVVISSDGSVSISGGDNVGISAGAGNNISLTQGVGGDVSIGRSSGAGNVLINSASTGDINLTSNASDINLEADQNIELQSNNGDINFQLSLTGSMEVGNVSGTGNQTHSSSSGRIARITQAGDIKDITVAGDIEHITEGGDITLKLLDGGNIIIVGIPTSDPSIPGAMYVDGSGFLKMSL
jgi:hypothetical protein